MEFMIPAWPSFINMFPSRDDLPTTSWKTRAYSAWAREEGGGGTLGADLDRPQIEHEWVWFR